MMFSVDTAVGCVACVTCTSSNPPAATNPPRAPPPYVVHMGRPPPRYQPRSTTASQVAEARDSPPVYMNWSQLQQQQDTLAREVQRQKAAEAVAKQPQRRDIPVPDGVQPGQAYLIPGGRGLGYIPMVTTVTSSESYTAIPTSLSLPGDPYHSPPASSDGLRSGAAGTAGLSPQEIQAVNAQYSNHLLQIAYNPGSVDNRSSDTPSSSHTQPSASTPSGGRHYASATSSPRSHRKPAPHHHAHTNPPSWQPPAGHTPESASRAPATSMPSHTAHLGLSFPTRHWQPSPYEYRNGVAFWNPADQSSIRSESVKSRDLVEPWTHHLPGRNLPHDLEKMNKHQGYSHTKVRYSPNAAHKHQSATYDSQSTHRDPYGKTQTSSSAHPAFRDTYGQSQVTSSSRLATRDQYRQTLENTQPATKSASQQTISRSSSQPALHQSTTHRMSPVGTDDCFPPPPSQAELHSTQAVQSSSVSRQLQALLSPGEDSHSGSRSPQLPPYPPRIIVETDTPPSGQSPSTSSLTSAGNLLLRESTSLLRPLFFWFPVSCNITMRLLSCCYNISVITTSQQCHTIRCVSAEDT